MKNKKKKKRMRVREVEASTETNRYSKRYTGNVNGVFFFINTKEVNAKHGAELHL